MSQLPGRGRSHDDDDDEKDGYLTLTELADYSRLSTATLKRYLTDAAHPLPHLQVGAPGSTRGRLLFRKREFDAWMERFRPSGAAPAGDFSWIKTRR